MLDAQSGGTDPHHSNAWTATCARRGGIMVCVGNEEIATFVRQCACGLDYRDMRKEARGCPAISLENDHLQFAAGRRHFKDWRVTAEFTSPRKKKGEHEDWNADDYKQPGKTNADDFQQMCSERMHVRRLTTTMTGDKPVRVDSQVRFLHICSPVLSS